MKQPQISEPHLKFVRSTLSVITNDIYVFGSRAKNTAKPLSDLDLVIMGEVDSTKLAKLRHDFEESNLPYKVDIVLWNRIDENFRNMIKDDLVAL